MEKCNETRCPSYSEAHKNNCAGVIMTFEKCHTKTETAAILERLDEVYKNMSESGQHEKCWFYGITYFIRKLHYIKTGKMPEGVQ